MKNPLVNIVLNLFLSGFCIADSPESTETSPFQSVILKGDAIVVTLPKVPKMLVRIGDGVARQTKESEVFRLVLGESVHFSETRHTSFSITPQFQPKPGLKVEHIFAGRSFRRGILTKKYFVPAKTDKIPAEQAVPSDGHKPSSRVPSAGSTAPADAH